MKEIELLGVLSCAAITAAFYFIRKRMFIYLLFCGAIIAGFAVAGSRNLDSSGIDEWLVILAGLCLYWLGLMSVRIMLVRSVSLNLLASFRDGRPGNTMEEDISGRLGDARKNRLVSSASGVYELTWFGLLIASSVTACYHILRIEK